MEGTRPPSAAGEGETDAAADLDRRYPPPPDPFPPQAGGEGEIVIRAGARFPRFRLAVAARGVGGAADHLVAVAGHAAGAAAHRLSCDPAAAWAGAARGTPGADPVVADPAAHAVGCAGDFGGRSPPAQSASAPGVDRPDRARGR